MLNSFQHLHTPSLILWYNSHMIASLSGTVQSKAEKYAVLNVQGVGYKVFVPAKVLESIIVGKELTLYTYLYTPEGKMELYGMPSREELDLFELLLTVSDVGPRVAMAVLSIGSLENVQQAISREDAVYLTKAPGIGMKTAERIIVELKDKLVVSKKGGAVFTKERTIDQKALDALLRLGYTKVEAQKALHAIPDDISDVSKKVKEALKFLGRT